MNKQECEQLIEAYIAWLREGLSVEQLENACELTTPFLDRHNDHIQIYVIKKTERSFCQTMATYYLTSERVDWI